MGTITSANSEVIFNCPGLGFDDIPVQGYAADDAFTQDAFDMAETRMGVDGGLSGGYTPSAKPFTIMLQPDSPTVAVFLELKANIEANKETFVCSFTIVLPSTGQVYTLSTGFLKNMQGMPSGKKVLDPIPVKFEFQDIFYAPI